MKENCLILDYIREYDMVQANISVLLNKEKIDEELYDSLSTMDKLKRNEFIGKMQRDKPELTDILTKGFDEYVDKLIEINKIKKNQILFRVKDAIFTKSKELKYLKINENIQFAEKNLYFLMINFNTSENSNQFIQIFKCYDTLKVRGSKIDTTHKAYDFLELLIESKMTNRDKESARYLKQISKIFKKDNTRLINAVDNEYLLTILKEVI